MTSDASAPPLNGDMSRRLAVDTHALSWQPASGGQVWRKRLHRVGPQEGGQVTSLVRYDPRARFAAHDHPDGEEIFVLEGTFYDEHRASPAGTYLLHPEGFRHQPYSEEGCLLFVKLRQYAGTDRPYVTHDTEKMIWENGSNSGIRIKTLYADPAFPDATRLERWDPNTAMETRRYPDGAEILVLSGSLQDEQGRYDGRTWLRLPAGSAHAPRSPEGCELYIKTGALAALESVPD